MTRPVTPLFFIRRDRDVPPVLEARWCVYFGAIGPNYMRFDTWEECIDFVTRELAGCRAVRQHFEWRVAEFRSTRRLIH